MDTLPHLALTQPLWLLLAIVPWLMMFRQQTSKRPGRLSRFADPHLWKWLHIKPGNPGRIPPAWVMLIAWLFAAIAASGPTLQKPQQETKEQRGIDIALVMDISPSMAATDITPSRLERAKLELQDFIKRLEGDRVGLIVYSSYAYNILPLTHDRTVLRYFINALDTNLTRRKGSNLLQALEQAQQLLEADELTGQPHSKAIVVLSDGESHDDINDDTAIINIATRFKQQRIPVYIMGTGTETGSALTEFDGRLVRHQGDVVISQLQRPILRTLAEQSGGAYSDMHADDTDWQTLFTHINKLERDRPYHITTTSPAYQLFPWFLGLSILLFIWSGVRRMDVIASLLLIPFFIAPEPAAASPWQEQQAYDAYQHKDYQKAIMLYKEMDTYNGRMGLGAAAYLLTDWLQAEQAYQQARQLAGNDLEHANAAYNHGNALALLGRYDEAISAYNVVLTWQPTHKRAGLNINLLNQSRLQPEKMQQESEKITGNAMKGAQHDPDAQLTNTELSRQDTSDQSSRTNDSANKQEQIKRAVSEWELGKHSPDDNWEIALRQNQARQESPEKVLHQRMLAQDAEHPVFDEEKPW